MSEPVTIEDPSEFARVPDGFERLWTPHRMVYIEGQRASDEAGEGCPFCAAPQKTDADGLIVYRGVTAYALLNLFPYNSGHLLVCPYRHVSTYDLATDEEVAELVHALEQAGLGERVQRESEAAAVRQCQRARGDVDGQFDAWLRQQFLDDGLVQHHRQQAVLQRVAAEDVGDLAADHRAQAEVEQGPRRMLARGAAAEVAARDEDLRAVVVRAVEREPRVRRAVGQLPPVVERVRSSPGPRSRISTASLSSR